MKAAHFKRIAPVCPRCQRDRGAAVPLTGAEGDLRFGRLICPEPGCRQEYPVIDGIPVLVPDVRGWVQAQQWDLMARRDLEHETESLLGDCMAPDSPFNISRQHVSIYAADHYGTGETGRLATGESVHDVLAHALRAAAPVPEGAVLDLGCAVGGTTFALARALPGRAVLGVDLSWGLLRVAREALDTGEVRFGLRESGLVYRPVTRPAPAVGPVTDEVDFWLGDALSPAFAPGSFALINALNLLDCVQSPVLALQQIDRLLQPGGLCLLATPFDWTTAATPLEAWIGGHSQRAPDGGRPDLRLKNLLAGGEQALPGLRLRLRQSETLNWQVRLHARCTMTYATELFVLEVPADGGAA